MPELLGFEDGESPLLILEYIVDAWWPPPWHDEDVAAVQAALEEIAATEVTGELPRLVGQRRGRAGRTSLPTRSRSSASGSSRASGSSARCPRSSTRPRRRSSTATRWCTATCGATTSASAHGRAVLRRLEARAHRQSRVRPRVLAAEPRSSRDGPPRSRSGSTSSRRSSPASSPRSPACRSPRERRACASSSARSSRWRCRGRARRSGCRCSARRYRRLESSRCSCRSRERRPRRPAGRPDRPRRAERRGQSATFLRLNRTGARQPDRGYVGAPAGIASRLICRQRKRCGWAGETVRAYLARRTGLAAAAGEVDELAAKLGGELTDRRRRDNGCTRAVPRARRRHLEGRATQSTLRRRGPRRRARPAG